MNYFASTMPIYKANGCFGFGLGGVFLICLISGCVTPLGTAIQHGDVQGVRTLLDQGADVHRSSRDCGIPIACAASLGNLEIVDMLLARGAEPADGIKAAAKAGDLRIVRLLIDRGALTNPHYAWSGTDALGQAAKAGHKAIVKLLLESGAQANGGAETPLMMAAEAGQVEIAQVLIEHGADVDARSAFWDTPLHFAARGNSSNHTQLVSLLLSQGADWNAKGRGGRTPLDEAKGGSNPETLRLLQQVKAGIITIGKSQSLTTSTTGTMLASDVDKIVSTANKPNPHAWAIVIGIEDYQQGLPRADFAANDAEVMRRYLTQMLGYPEKNVVLLANDRATKTSMEKYLEGWLPDHVGKGDSVFVYFSGHGSPNAKTAKAYLVPYDGDPGFIEKTGYPLDRLYDGLSSLSAKEIVVVLDSCFSGAGGRSVIAEGMRPMVLSVENPILSKGRVVVLSASSGVQVSSTYKEKRHGLLTYYFFKGLLGEADHNHDSRIELRELYEYLKPEVERTARREYHNEQVPQLIGSSDLLGRDILLVGEENR